MIESVNYLKYQDCKDLIREYFDALFFFREKNVIDVLKKYCELKGNAINDYMSCHFATEFSSENDEEYFGKNGVAFYLDCPAVDVNCIVVLSYAEFLEVVKHRYEDYIKTNTEKKEEIMKLLNCLEEEIKAHM